MAKKPEEIIRDDVRSLTAYHVPDSSGMVKLDAMENPYELPPELRARLATLIESAALNRYPDPLQWKLKAEISKIKGAAMENIFLGNGSDEVIDLMIRIFCEPGVDHIVTMPPTYGMYSTRMAGAAAGGTKSSARGRRWIPSG